MTRSKEADLIQRLAQYVDKHTLAYYEQWVRDADPIIDKSVLIDEAIRLVRSSDERLARSALQAIGSFGDLGCVQEIQAASFTKTHPEEARIVTMHIKERALSPEELLGRVHDQESFLLFVRSLARERAIAQEIEASEPRRYALDGAIGWKNADISSFLYAASSTCGASASADWRWFAEFLYNGKVVE
ncbi:hypothetical protein [uncultured Xanthomonas sp.]|uniref:hypothetical protein n=1 Tax=uncultured Xanthomonas sp. TaxID=152831 RepID=UPI0025ED5649|nr:hypothetical protein [uncultured Xanthomonas sp.]